MSSSEAGPLTVFSQDILDETWEKLLAHSHDSFKAEGNLNLFLEELNREDQWYSTKNLLLRYGKEHFEGCESENELAEAMFQATKKALEGTNFPRTQKKQYEKYLSGETNMIKRMTLHRMALVFHFDLDFLFKFFAYGRGEPPFFWHNSTECIYYYVLKNKTEKLAVEADKLIKLYNERANCSKTATPDTLPSQEQQLFTQTFRENLDTIKDEDSLIDYLCAQEHFLSMKNMGETARKEVETLYKQAKALYPLQSALEGLGVSNGKPQKDHPDVSAGGRPIKDGAHPRVQSDLLSKTLDVKHFECVVDGEEKATKQDIVFLRFYNTAVSDLQENGERLDSMRWSGFSEQKIRAPKSTVFLAESQQSASEQHKDFVWNWLLETNEILRKCSLPEMCLACRFDATVLSALMSDKPEEFFADVMWHFVEDIDEVDDEDM